MTISTVTVAGMTCQHCVASVTEEIAGVTDVAVDLASGVVSVTSDRPLPDGAVRVAVEEAGYALS